MNRSGALSPAQQEIILSTLASLRPAAVYLFGSAAADKLRGDSDIDLAFLPQAEAADPMIIFNASQVLAGELGREVDLLDLTTASTVMAKEVIRTGVLLADAFPLLRQDFEMRTLSDYARLNEERQPVLSAAR
jgi:predicted nucleotidyltransferase